MAVEDLHNYLVKFNVVGGSAQSVTATYRSNVNSGTAKFTIPTTYQLGLTKSDQYVTRWYYNEGCTGNWSAAYDEINIACTTNNLYATWQDYSDLFGGAGTKSDPFIIEADNLVDFANYVNEGGNTRGLYFKQQGEFDVSVITNNTGNNWTPIGHQRVFEGDYDGGGYRIIKATNTSCDYDAFGIFGKVSGTIHNLGVENCNFQTTMDKSRGGAIAGKLLRCDMEQPTTAQIRDCYAASNTITAMYSGGLVGEMANASSMSHCLETQSTLHCNYGGMYEKKSEDSNKKESKISSKRKKRIIQALKDETVDMAQYAYRLWPDKDENSARSYFYKCLDGKTNDSGDVYSFTDDEFVQLESFLTDVVPET